MSMYTCGLDENSRVCIYLRKSRDEREKDAKKEDPRGVLRRHEQVLRNLAGKMGLNPSHIYEEVVSGETLDQRPEARAMLAAVWRGEWDAVMIVEVERLGRGSQGDQGRIVSALRNSTQFGDGCRVVTPMKIYDPRNDSDMEQIEFGLFMSARELSVIKRRLAMGKSISIANGEFIMSHAPFGYDKAEIDGYKTLVANGDAWVVRLVFHLAAVEHRTLAEIQGALRELAVPSPSGLEVWPRKTISEVLHNEHYVGMIVWGKHKTITEADENLNEKKKVVRNADYLVIDGIHEGLVGPEVFEAAARALENRVPKRIKEKVMNPYAGVLFCKKCGRPMRVYSKTGRPRRAYHATWGNDGCWCHPTSLEALNAAVVAALRSKLCDVLMELSDPRSESSRARREEARAEATAALERTKRAYSKLFERLDQERITEEEFDERRAVLRERMDTLRSTISDLCEEFDEEEAKERAVQLHAVLDVMESAHEDEESMNRLVRHFIERIDFESPLGKWEKGDECTVHIEMRAFGA